MSKVKSNAVEILETEDATLMSKEGHFIKADGTLAGADDKPVGAILDADETTATFAWAGGYGGTLHLRAGAAVSRGDAVGPDADGAATPASSVKAAIACEDADAGELFEAVLVPAV